jgi:hypothetical protein
MPEDTVDGAPPTANKTSPPLPAEPRWIGICSAIEMTKAAAGPSSTGYVIGTFLQAMRSGMVGFSGTGKKRRQDAAFWQNATLENVFDEQGKIVDVRVAHTYPEPDTDENAGSSWRRAHTITSIGTVIDGDDLADWLRRHLRHGAMIAGSNEIQSSGVLVADSVTDPRVNKVERKNKTAEKLDQKYRAIIENLEDGVRPTGPHRNIPNAKEWLYRVQLKMRPDLFQEERSNSVRKKHWPPRALKKGIGLDRRTVERALKKLVEENAHVRELLAKPGILPDLGDHPYPYPS